MKKLILLSTSLFVFSSLGLSTNALADHRNAKKTPVNTVKKATHEMDNDAADLLNELGGAANKIVGEASDTINTIGERIGNGFKQDKNKRK
jgi:hypothetical protein